MSSRRVPGVARRRWRFRRGHAELAVFALVYALYSAGRWMFVGRLSLARRHAEWLIHSERVLHIAIEGPLQRALGGGIPGAVLANIYLAAQLLVLPGSLIGLYRRAPKVYKKLRTTIVGTWVVSTPIFALYPVAPPRLAGIGVADTVSRQAAVALTGRSTLFYNPYAALPSLHVGLAFAIGIAAATTLRRRWCKIIALLWGPIVTLAVIATGNHYVLDAIGGVLVTTLVHLFSRVLARHAMSRVTCAPGPSVVGASPAAMLTGSPGVKDRLRRREIHTDRLPVGDPAGRRPRTRARRRSEDKAMPT